MKQELAHEERNFRKIPAKRWNGKYNTKCCSNFPVQFHEYCEGLNLYLERGGGDRSWGGDAQVHERGC